MFSRSMALIASLCLAFSSAAHGQLAEQLFITEVMWDSSHPGADDFDQGGHANGDWFELFNASDQAIDMSGFQWDDDKQLSDADGITVFPAGFVIEPAEVIVIVREDNDQVEFTDGFRASWGLPDDLRIIGKDTFADSGPEQFSGLSGNGDEVNLYDAGGTLITSISFGEATAGHSNQWGFDNGSVVDLGIAVAGESGAFVAVSDGSNGRLLRDASGALEVDANGNTIIDPNSTYVPPMLDVASPGFVFGFGNEVLDVPAVCRLVAAGERTQADLEAALAAAGSLAGDTDLNGTVEFADFLVLSQNFGMAVSLGDEGGWGQGDFDCNGTIEFADFLAMSENFGKSGGTAASSVPEPSGAEISLFAVLGLMLLFRRRAA